MDIVRLPLILMLMAVALSDNTVSIQCTSCSPNICFQLYGGGFDGYTYATNSASSCSAAGSYPQTIIFTCSHSQCDQGCAITTDAGGSRTIACSQTTQGLATIANLNVMYNAQQGTTNQSYDWCNCSSLSAGAIAGIVLGGIALVVLLVCLVGLCRKKTSEEKELMMAAKFEGES